MMGAARDMIDALQIVERRIKPRVETKVKLRVGGRGSSTQTYTGNLSKSGVFLETQEPFAAMGEKVQLHLLLANAKEPIRVTAQVSRVQGPNHVGHPQGIGLQFLRVESRQARTFERLIDRLLDARGIGCRRYPRIRTQLLAEMRSKEQIRKVISQNLSKGGLFLRTPVNEFVLGDLVSLVILHPNSKRKFAIDAEVVHIRKGTSAISDEFIEGLGVKFVDLTAAREEEVSLFLRSILSGKRT